MVILSSDVPRLLLFFDHIALDIHGEAQDVYAAFSI